MLGSEGLLGSCGTSPFCPESFSAACPRTRAMSSSHIPVNSSAPRLQNFLAFDQLFQRSRVAAKAGTGSSVYGLEEIPVSGVALPAPAPVLTRAWESRVCRKGALGRWAGRARRGSGGHKGAPTSTGVGASGKEVSVLIPLHVQQDPRVRMRFLPNVHSGADAWPGGPADADYMLVS